MCAACSWQWRRRRRSDTGQAGISDAQVQEIITRFAAKEDRVRPRAASNYTYRQTARVQEVDAGGAPEGKWEMVVDVIFSTEGKRTERVVRAPVQTLSHILLTPETSRT